MENENNKKEEQKEEKVGVIPADDLKGSDADGAYTGDDESPEELAKQQLGADAEADDKAGDDK